MQIWSRVVLGAGAEGHAKTCARLGELPSSSATPSRLQDNSPGEEGDSVLDDDFKSRQHFGSFLALH